MIDKETVESAVRNFLSLPDQSAPIDYLRCHLPETAVLYIVGGSIRNLIMEMVFENAPQTEDIDIFIAKLPHDYELTDLLVGEVFEVTDLDGIRWHPKSSGVAFDLCLLPKFVMLHKYRLQPSLENLLNCIDFTINATVFDVTNGQLYEKKCIAAIENGCMDFNTHRLYTKQLLAYRILHIHHKTGLMLSEAIFLFLKNQIALSDLSDLKILYERKIGVKKARALMADYDYICSFSDFAEYTTAAKNMIKISQKHRYCKRN